MSKEVGKEVKRKSKNVDLIFEPTVNFMKNNNNFIGKSKKFVVIKW